ncbi:MAG: MaoC family dehydratase [Haloferacaceae archaeon]
MHGRTGYDPATPARAFATAWLRSGRRLSRGVERTCRSMAAANRALAPTGGGPESGTGTGTGTGTGAGAGGEADRRSGSDAVAFARSSWASERTVDDWRELSVGDVVRFTKRVDEADVAAFARASGDTNRLHLDDEFAERSRFGRRIVHGTLVSGLISAALARLPGLTIYLSQDLAFRKPADVGERLTAVVEIVEAIGDGRYRLSTVVENADGDRLVDGEAVVIVDAPPGADGGGT